MREEHIGDIGDMFGTYAVFFAMWEFHISEISVICLGRMQCSWEFQISVFVGVSHIGDIGDMFGTYAYAGFTHE